MSSARKDLGAFTDKLRKAVGNSAKQAALKPLGEEAVRLIVTRTRLGYGVTDDGQERARLKPLSSRWIAQRKRLDEEAAILSQFTTTARSNLTFTGQMLDSMQVIRIAQGQIVIGPKGYRTDPLSRGLSNEQVANYVAAAGRKFNNLSRLEQAQLVRFYRRKFGDLLRNERLDALTRES